MQTATIIYEDNDLLRESLNGLIQDSPDCFLLGSFPNVLDVEKQVQNLKPHLILMDIEMPGGVSGVDAVKKIRVFDKQTPIIMLTIFDDRTNILEAIMSGASGYLLKKHISTHFHQAIREVLSGGAPMSPSVARMVIASMQKNSSAGNNMYNLSPREKELLVALSQGLGYKILADKYNLSIDTVRSHLKNIYRKLEVHSQLEAITKGKDAGLI
ncbi:MAG: response regulator transcription factor [Chitinophagaceae bacterium]|jgi:DNA-binding NarL/FixJ family response regulator|nr:response regulator transcription factor [Chitinophagaceae bacterium]